MKVKTINGEGWVRLSEALDAIKKARRFSTDVEDVLRDFMEATENDTLTPKLKAARDGYERLRQHYQLER